VSGPHLSWYSEHSRCESGSASEASRVPTWSFSRLPGPALCLGSRGDNGSLMVVRIVVTLELVRLRGNILIRWLVNCQQTQRHVRIGRVITIYKTRTLNPGPASTYPIATNGKLLHLLYRTSSQQLGGRSEELPHGTASAGPSGPCSSPEKQWAGSDPTIPQRKAGWGLSSRWPVQKGLGWQTSHDSLCV
jgi:hypothetical protein